MAVRQNADENMDHSEDAPRSGELKESKRWQPRTVLQARCRRGEQIGEYVLEWDAVAGVDAYEVFEKYGYKESTSIEQGTRLVLQKLPSGLHDYYVRPVIPGVPTDWDEIQPVSVSVPEPVKSPPMGVRLGAAPAGTFAIAWEPVKGEFVEEYLVFEVIAGVNELVARVGDITQCVVTPTEPNARHSYIVRAINWSGLGPASKPVHYDPEPRKSWLSMFAGVRPGSTPAKEISGPPAELKPEVLRCLKTYELCEEVTRRLKRHGIHMTGLQLEQRFQGTNEYRSVDKRNTTELISLNLVKGPDYRLQIYGNQGERLQAQITFDKKTWEFIVTFEPLICRS